MIKNLFAHIIFLCSIILGQAPKPDADSLLSLLPVSEGKTKVDLLTELSFLKAASNADEAVNFGLKALALAQEMNYPSGEGWARLRIANGYFYGKKYELISSEVEKAISILEPLNDSLGVATGNNLLGIKYYKFKDFNNSLNHHLKALNIFEALGLDDKISSSANNIGMVYRDMSNHRKALEYYLKLIPIKEKLGDKKRLAVSLNNIGILYLDLEEYTNAIDFFNRSLKLREEINDKRGIALSLNNLGNAYNQLEQREKALEFYSRSIEIKKELNDAKGIAVTHNNIGKVYHDMGNRDQALLFYKKSLKLKEELGNKSSTIYTLNNLGLFYLDSGEFTLSEKYYTKSLKYAEEIKSETQQRDILGYLSDLYSSKGDYKKAFKNQLAHQALKDTLLRKENEKQITELHSLYELEKKEAENNILKQNNEIQKLKIENQALLIYAFIAFSLLIIALAIIAYNRYLVKNRINKRLAEALQELKIANANKNKFFSIIAHDLKNPFGALMGFSELLLDKDESLTAEERKEIVSEINNNSQIIYRLFDNLLNWALAQRDKIIIDKDILNVHYLVEESIQFYHLMARQKNITVTNSIETKLFLEADRNTLSVVITNLINNALKFTPAGGNLTISNKIENGFVKIIFEDTGIGLSEEQLKNIFLFGETLSASKNGTGLGLMLCREFIELNKGSIEAVSSGKKGSTFIITLPAFK